MREIEPTASEWITSGYIANSKTGKRKYDPLSILGAVAGPVVGGLLGGASSSGTQQGGTQTVNNDPWAAAQPWMKANLETGQNLQNYYQKNPFNQQQQAAYGNLASGADYLNRLTPGLLQQFSQPQAFNRNNPSAMPSPLNFSAPDVSPQMAHAYGGMMRPSMPVQGDMNQTQNPFGNGGIAPTPQVAPQDIQKMIDDALKAQQAQQPQNGQRSEADRLAQDFGGGGA